MPRHMSDFDKLLMSSDLDADILLDEPMSKHTTYRIGGSAKYYIVVNTVEALRCVIRSCSRSGIDHYIVGKGANLLVSDAGYDGAVIVLGREFRTYNIDATTCRLTCGCGVVLGRLVTECYANGLSGLEFAVGVPGTIGGALAMNAGSATDYIGDAVRLVTFVQDDSEARVKTVNKSEINWEYRNSNLDNFGIAIEADLKLRRGNAGEIRANMDEYMQRRKDCQPLSLPSCGSVFKNPITDAGEKLSAGKLIDECGLRGRRIGGACISNIHANFIVNDEGASASDVKNLIELAKSEVKNKFNIDLICEVRFLG